MNSLFLNAVVIGDFTIAECLFYFLNVSFTVAVASSLTAFYIFLRPKLPSRVNCWFCNHSFLVPYESRHCFDCRYCDQYNGFKSDGDYDIDVLERKKNANLIIRSSKEKNIEATNGLCKSCNTNQQLKVQKLARFVPSNEATYDIEIEKYKEELEKYDRLCDDCNLVLTQTLQTQHYDLLTKRLNNHCRAEPLSTSLPCSLRCRIADLLNTCSIICIVCIVISTSMQTLQKYQFIKNFEMLEAFIFQMIPDHLLKTCIVGAFLNLCSRMACFRLVTRDLLFSSSWLILLYLTWMNLPTIVLPASMVGFAINIIPNRNQLIKKTISPPPIPVPQTSSKPKFVEKIPEANNIKKIPVPNNIDKVKESVVVEPKVVEKSSQNEYVPESPRRIETRSQSAKKVEAIAKPQKLKQNINFERSRLFSPPPEVYNAFNGLRLNSVEPTEISSKKPANYLFESIQFDSKKKKSIIKPSKFNSNSNLMPVKVDTFNETPRCSSTQCDSIELADFNGTALSPISNFPPKCSGLPSSPYNYDYDMTPYGPPSYLTSMPMGHTTVYTYTRPSPYPFNYSPPRFTPPFPSYESPLSPRISEGYTANTSNVSFSSINESQKWAWLKRGFYIFSVLLNFLTMLFLVFSVWKR